MSRNWGHYVCLFLLKGIAYALTSFELGESFLTIVGTDPVIGPTNCIPFGLGSFGPYKGFIYSGDDPTLCRRGFRL